MSSNNPSITVSDIVTDVEARLGAPNISTSVYLPWVSYAYNRTYLALMNSDARVRERLFGNYVELTLTNGTAEYSLSSKIPRFGGIIKIEVKYGGTGDDWNRASRLDSLSNWKIQNNVSTSYRGKNVPLYYVMEDTIGFIPTPPSTDSGTPYARVWYVRRPYQLTLSTDVIDIEYRFIYPIVEYVQAKAIQRANEDYGDARAVEQEFKNLLDEVCDVATAELSDLEGGDSIAVSSDSQIFENPFR